MNFKCLKDRVKKTTPYKLMTILKVDDIHELEVEKFVQSCN